MGFGIWFPLLIEVFDLLESCITYSPCGLLITDDRKDLSINV